jgi:hypothetical protein
MSLAILKWTLFRIKNSSFEKGIKADLTQCLEILEKLTKYMVD